jgi:hypothetical protein
MCLLTSGVGCHAHHHGFRDDQTLAALSLGTVPRQARLKRCRQTLKPLAKVRLARLPSMRGMLMSSAAMYGIQATAGNPPNRTNRRIQASGRHHDRLSYAQRPCAQIRGI